MTHEEQRAFQQARARIERNLSELASLSRDGRVPPDVFFGRFLELTIEALDAMGGAVWSIDSSGARRVAEVSYASSGYAAEPQKEWIDRVVAHTASSAKPCIVAVQDQQPQAAESIGNDVPHPFFYTPVVLDGRTLVVFQIWLKQAGDPRGYADIASFLGGLAQHVCLFLRGAQHVAHLQSDTAARNMLRFQEEILGELDPAVIHSAASNYLVDLLSCQLAAVLHRKAGKWRLEAASNQEVVDPKAAQSQTLAAVAASLPSNVKDGFLTASADSEDPQISALGAAGYGALAWCRLRSSKNAPENLLLFACWHRPPADAATARSALAWLAGQVAKGLDAATHHHHMPLRPLFSRLGRLFRAWNEDRRRRVFLRVGVPCIVLFAALVFPVSYKIKADCIVVPQRTSSIVAETSGKITAVLAPEGAVVRSGQELARLEDTEQTTQLAVSRQQLGRWRVEEAKAQTLGNEAERKIAELAAKREEENIRCLEYLRERTVLRSPIDGVVLTRNVQHRQGEAMEPGKVYCEIGSLGSFELQLDLRQQDLGPVLQSLRAGRVLPVDFILYSHSRFPLRGELASAESISQLPETRHTETVFTARIPFPEGLPEAGAKAGYTGKASIVLGWRPWGWILLRPFLQYWRMNWSL